jgi:hypothetical protein
MASKTFAMRGEHLDHAAFAYLTLAAFRQHAAYFGAQQLKARYLAFNIGKVRAGDCVRPRAGALRFVGQRKQFTDGVHLKAQLTGMPDKAEPPHVLFVIRAPVGTGPQWRREEIDAFIITDGRHFDAGFRCKLADRYCLSWSQTNNPLDPLVTRGCKVEAARVKEIV